MKKLVLLLVVSSILLSSCSQNKKNTLTSNQNSETYQTKIDSLLSVYDNNTDFMGSLALSHKGKTIYSNTVGFSDINTKEKPNANTKYRIGSISKMYTAVLIFKAVEENKLQLEQTIDSYFPNVKNAGKITIAQLLHHRSGIPSFTSDKSFMEFHTQYKSPDEMLAIISNYNSDFKPNTAAAYSNSNYFLLSQILVRLYNMSYEDLFLEKIIKPLGLQNTFSGGKININNNDCYSYVYTDKWTEFPETDMSIALGGGSIVSTPTEVNTFLEALLTGKLISSENLALMKTIKDNHGMGIFRYKINDREGFGHRGRLDAFRSTAIYFPDEELSFTLATNASKTDINTRYTEILKLYFNDAPVEISESEIKKFAGVFVSQNDPSDKAVFSQNGNKLIHIIKNEFEETLIYKGNNRFVMEQMYGEAISFTFSGDGKQLTFEQGDYKGIYLKE